MAIKASVSSEIQCHSCGTPLPKNEVSYLVIWNNNEQKYVPAPFCPRHLGYAQVAYRPLSKPTKLEAFLSITGAERRAKSLNDARAERLASNRSFQARDRTALPASQRSVKNWWSGH